MRIIFQIKLFRRKLRITMRLRNEIMSILLRRFSFSSFMQLIERMEIFNLGRR
jgi:hypothetical protein